MSDFDRRTLLGSATFVAAVLPYIGLAKASPVEAAPWRAFAQRALPHRESTEAIGREYLTHASPREATRLSALVIGKLSGLRGTANDAEILTAAIRTDYAAARTVCVGGWILSETEVALSVLSLDRGPA